MQYFVRKGKTTLCSNNDLYGNSLNAFLSWRELIIEGLICILKSRVLKSQLLVLANILCKSDIFCTCFILSGNKSYMSIRSRLSLFVSPIYTSFLFVVNILMMGFFSQKSVYTNMNVWTHYLYWSDRYPTGPNDEKCAGHSRAKSKISVSREGFWAFPSFRAQGIKHHRKIEDTYN